MKKKTQAKVQIVFYGEASSENQLIAYVNAFDELFISVDTESAGVHICFSEATTRALITHLQEQLKSM